MLMSLFVTPPWPDAILIESVARDFLQTGIFRYKIWGDFDPTYLAANFNNGPLYSVVHALMLRIFHTTDSRWMTLLNIFLLVGSTVNIVKVLRLSGRQLWLLVVILCNPLVLNYVGIVRPEFLNLFLFTLLWRFLDARHVFFAGVTLGLAALTHQFALFFIPPAIALIARRGSGSREILKNIAILGFACSLTLSPYIHYIGSHWADFQFQLLGNQIGESVQLGLASLAKSFVTPLFYPSIAPFTLTGAIPRWVLDGLPLGLIFTGVATTTLWRRRQKCASTTTDALIVWLSLNLGCAVTTFSVYVTFSISVLAVSLMRDAFPVISERLRCALGVAAIVGISHQLVLAHLVQKNLFQWEEYQVATACLSDALPPNAKVYVMAYPDPSVQLANWRPDLDIRRYIDFPQYGEAWKKIVAHSSFFITSADGIFLNRFDHGGPLSKAMATGQFRSVQCKSGPVHLILHRTGENKKAPVTGPL